MTEVRCTVKLKMENNRKLLLLLLSLLSPLLLSSRITNNIQNTEQLDIIINTL